MKDLEAMSKRPQTYDIREIAVTFDLNVCIHSSVCVRGKPRRAGSTTSSSTWLVGRQDDPG